MRQDEGKSEKTTELHRRAEERLREKKTEAGLPRKKGDLQRLLHELQIRQVEMEMQNEELTESSAEMKTQFQRALRMEAIGALAGGIAHDFNNILSVIMGYAEMALLELPELSPSRHSLDQITKAAFRARDLVKQVLAFSPQAEQQPKPVKVSSIVNGILKLLGASLPTNIEIQRRITVERDTVLADPTLIHQVLMNLCTNAHQAMLEDGGVLQVSLTNADIDIETGAEYRDLKPGSYLRLTVSDTGNGMTPEVMEHIFEPYSTTREKGAGTGPGLAVVHLIVAGLGGRVMVRSGPRKGSTFDVLFPVVDTESAPVPEVRENLPMGYERILFVDDEEAIADLWGRMLQHLGYEVEVRASSIEALEAFKAQPDKFDLVITDMTMPNITGDKLAGELMRIRSDIAVIICTGPSERISDERAREIGIRAFVMKPVVLREVARTIRQVLGRGGQKMEPVKSPFKHPASCSSSEHRLCQIS